MCLLLAHQAQHVLALVGPFPWVGDGNHGSSMEQEHSSPALSEVKKSRSADCRWQHMQARGPWPAQQSRPPVIALHCIASSWQAQDWTAHALHKRGRLLATSLAAKRE